MKISGLLYIGETSSSVPATLLVDEKGRAQLIVLEQPALSVTDISITDIEIPPRIGNTARYLRLANGSVFETKDNAHIDELQQRYFNNTVTRANSLITRLEKSWPAALFGLIVVSGLIAWFSIWGAPSMARQIAFLLPNEMSMNIGRDTLRVMDRTALEPTTLDVERQNQIEQVFTNLLPDNREGLTYHLVFRRGARIGANAFALPGATIVITDELVNLAENDQQIASVLLHEIGHVKQRHVMRQLIQQAGLLGLLSVITGDISGASEAVLAAPGTLLQASYSRDAEYEADTYALEYMQAHNISPLEFSEMMRNMKNWRPKNLDVKQDDSKEESGSNDTHNDDKDVISTGLQYLSTHPATDERIKRFEKASTSKAQP